MIEQRLYVSAKENVSVNLNFLVSAYHVWFVAEFLFTHCTFHDALQLLVSVLVQNVTIVLTSRQFWGTQCTRVFVCQCRPQFCVLQHEKRFSVLMTALYPIHTTNYVQNSILRSFLGRSIIIHVTEQFVLPLSPHLVVKSSSWGVCFELVLITIRF